MRKRRPIWGWGINDVDYSVTQNAHIEGKYKTVWYCPYYLDWKGIVRRCHSKVYQSSNATYKDCTVCEEWKYLSNFIAWVDSQPNRDWLNCQPDKDFLFKGNKHYSPDTVVYIPAKLNTFIIDRSNYAGKLATGVCASNNKKNPFQVHCSNPFTGEQEYLGCYPTEHIAHLVWRAKKNEHAMKLAEEQQDSRVKDALINMYSNLKE